MGENNQEEKIPIPSLVRALFRRPPTLLVMFTCMIGRSHTYLVPVSLLSKVLYPPQQLIALASFPRVLPMPEYALVGLYQVAPDVLTTVRCRCVC